MLLLNFSNEIVYIHDQLPRSNQHEYWVCTRCKRAVDCLPRSAYRQQHLNMNYRLFHGSTSSVCRQAVRHPTAVTWRWDFLSNELGVNAHVRRYIAVCLLFWCVCVSSPAMTQAKPRLSTHQSDTHSQQPVVCWLTHYAQGFFMLLLRRPTLRALPLF